MGLPEIEAHVAKREWEEALELALKEWRLVRAPAYANLIEALAAKASRPAITPDASNSDYYGLDHFQWKWVARARSTWATDTDPLMASFGVDLRSLRRRNQYGARTEERLARALALENVTVDADAVGPFITLCERVDYLAIRGPDPRVTKALVRYLKQAPLAVEGALAVATYGPIFELLEDFADVRILPAVEALPESPARERLLFSLRQWVVPTLADDEKIRGLARDLGFTEPAAPLDVSELFELVVLEPDDDTPRAILADHWLEVGDLRGELVALQLRAAKGEASTTELERMASLQASVESEWLGDLALLTHVRRFHRGFLEEIALSSSETVPLARWEAASKDPLLGTVRVLRPGLANDPTYAFFLFSPALRNLEEVEIATEQILQAVIRGRQEKLRRIELTTPQTDLVKMDREVELLLLARDSHFERITIPFRNARSIVDFAPLLSVATERCEIVLSAMDARFVAKRTPDGIALDITSRDALMVNAALDLCPWVTLSLHRPHGAKLYPAGRWSGLGTRLWGKPGVTLDPAWTERLRS